VGLAPDVGQFFTKRLVLTNGLVIVVIPPHVIGTLPKNNLARIHDGSFAEGYSGYGKAMKN
jgi:hypothetical protein